MIKKIILFLLILQFSIYSAVYGSFSSEIKSIQETSYFSDSDYVALSVNNSGSIKKVKNNYITYGNYFESKSLTKNVSDSLNNTILSSISKNKELIIGDVYIDTGTIVVKSNCKITFVGTVNGRISTNKVPKIYIDGKNIIINNIKTKRVVIEVSDTSENVVINGAELILKEYNSALRIPALKLNASVTSVVKNSEFRNISAVVDSLISYAPTNMLYVVGSYNCKFYNIAGTNFDRTFRILSSENTTYENLISYSGIRTPVVGILNMYDTIAHGRGFINNKYINCNIFGWKEEGFSFDANMEKTYNASGVWCSKIASVTDSVIVLQDYSSKSFSNYQVTFLTGLLAGNSYPIRRSNNDSIILTGFYGARSAVSVNDFVSIEIKCYGNIIENCSFYSSGDITGLLFFGLGGGTIVRNPYFSGCQFGIASVLTNNTYDDSKYLIPHNIILDGMRISNTGSEKILTRQDSSYFSMSNIGNKTIDPKNVPIYNLKVINSDIYRINWSRVANITFDNNTMKEPWGISFEQCDNFKTFRNRNINIYSASDTTKINAYKGQRFYTNTNSYIYNGSNFIAE